MERTPVVHEYDTRGAVRNPENSLVLYTLTLDGIRCLAEGVARRELVAEVASGVRFRVLYTVLGLWAEVYADGELHITV